MTFAETAVPAVPDRRATAPPTQPALARVLHRLSLRMAERAAREYRSLGPNTVCEHLDHLSGQYARAAEGQP